MKTTRLFALVAVFAATFVSGFSQSAVVTETAVSAPVTKTETRTYVRDGKTVTERVTITTEKESESSTKTYKAAIFVSNRAGAAYDAKIASLEDYVTARVTDLGITVISRETAANAVAKIDGAAVNATDAALAQSATALRLAQTLGADYLLQVTLTGYESNRRNIDAYGVKTSNDDRTLRVTYKVLDGTTGGSLAADTVKVSKTVQQGAGNAATQLEGLDELLDEASLKVATSLKGRLARITAPAAAQGLVTVTLATEAADLTIPDIRIGVENTVTISESKLKVSALSATIEVDGIAVGTAPGSITVKPGLSKLRITRAGFKPYERTVNFINGQSLTVALELSEDGYKRWKDSTSFLNELKNNAKLTDGEVKVLEGKAKALEQSGFKVNTTAAPTVTINEYDGHYNNNNGPRKETKDRSIFGF